MIRPTRPTLAMLAMLATHACATELTVPFAGWHKQETVRFATPDEQAALRTYTHGTSMPLRAGDPQQVSYAETAGVPRVRSGNLAFDALFAQAGAEMRQDAVAAIRDDSYNDGQPIPCACFATGEKWHYVWTRDLSYAAHLGLAMLDPVRVKNSLQFKLSGYRAGSHKADEVPGSADGLQIIQDTGSGGSWPVSTDRVTWAFGAVEALKALPAAERAAIVPVALKALTNTIEIDRVAAWDAATGLYNGEESFLDWREQSYASWIPDQLASMATSQALSTNVAHWQALTLAAQLATEQSDAATARRYTGWAADLKAAINRRLWLQDAGMYSSVTAGHFDGAPMHKFDWLGQALAIVTGIADTEQAASILAHYPHGPLGAPVIWPQQPGRAVYHNRAIWPFVTGYGLQAAIRLQNVAVADAAYDTLLRAAAVNASNMENFEWLLGRTMLDLPDQQSGPVVNSRRQLWSVGAYLGAVVGGVFGVQTTNDGISVAPFITAKLRSETLKNSDNITLANLQLQGRHVDVRIALPKVQQQAGYYAVQSVTLNGKAVDAANIRWSQLQESNTIDVQLGALLPGRQAITRVTASPVETDPAVFSPAEPAIASFTRGAHGVTLKFDAAPVRGTYYNVYRDGGLVAGKVTAAAWTDAKPGGASCYAVEAVFSSSGNRSHHSAPSCIGTAIDVPVAGGVLRNWGAPSDSFRSDGIAVKQAGTYAVQVRYRNNAHQINLGTSGGVKWMKVRDGAGSVIAQGVVQLPHSPAGQTVYSTPLAVTLKPGAYAAELTDFMNMSYLQANATYGDAGGKAGASNRFDIYGVRVMRVER